MKMKTISNISNLRNLVLKKQEYRNLLGRDSFLELYKRYKTNNWDIKSVVAPKEVVYLQHVRFDDTLNGKRMFFEVYQGDRFIYHKGMHLYGKDMVWNNVVKLVNNWEKEVTALKDTPRHIEDLSPKCIYKLFSDKYTPKRRVDDFGNPVTTVIDRLTQEPVEVYVKSIETSHCTPQYELYLKNSNGDDELIGVRNFYIFSNIDYVFPGKMNVYANDRYEGIGLRLHQLAIEKMLQKNLKTVKIKAIDAAIPFHTKALFKVDSENLIYLSKRKLIDKLGEYARERNMDLSEEELRKLIPRYTLPFGYVNGAKAFENLFKLCFEKRKTSVDAYLRMYLDRKAIKEWKSFIKKQPILLDLSV